MRKKNHISRISREELLDKSKTKDLSCKCGRIVKHCSNNTEEVTCHICTTLLPKELNDSLLMTKEERQKIKNEKKSKFPPGWKLLSEFVDSDRNVYYRGIIQPRLKGKKEPTDVQSILTERAENRKNKPKLSKKEKQELKEQKLLKQHEKKQKAIEEKKRRDAKKLKKL
jgi:hypothetical protein